MDNVKRSKERSETARYLRQWRKTFDIKKTSDYFGHGTTKTCKIIRRSKRYMESSKRKGKIYRYLRVKNHPTRIKIAKYLREWKNGMPSGKIAEKYGTDKKTVLHYLALSERYTSSTKLLSKEEQMQVKGSPFRRHVAKLLLEWRSDRHIRRLCRKFKVCFGLLQKDLSFSKMYRKFSQSRSGLKERESRFVLRFAKKLRVVNSMGGKCMECGSDDIFVLEFHHHQKDKDNIVSKLLESDISQAEKEAKKCVLLCANCHMREHSQVELFDKLRDIIKYRSIRL